MVHIEVRHSDVFSNVDGAFGLIIFDPPFCWFAPRDLLEAATTDENYRAMTRFFRQARQHLTDRGRMLIFFGSSGDVAYLQQLIDHEGFQREVLPQRSLVGMIGVRDVAVGVPDLLSAQRLDCAPHAIGGIQDCGDPGAAPSGVRLASAGCTPSADWADRALISALARLLSKAGRRHLFVTRVLFCAGMPSWSDDDGPASASGADVHPHPRRCAG